MKRLKTIIARTSKNYSTKYQRNNFNLISQDVFQDYRGSLPNIVEEVCNKKMYLNVPKIKDHLIKITSHILEDENNTSSIIMLHAYSHLQNPEKMISNEKKQAFILVCALDLLHLHKNILENVEKNNYIPNISVVNLKPTSEANLLRSFIYDILANYFNGTIYKNLLELFNKSFLYHVIGEYLSNTLDGKNNKYAGFNLQSYNTMCEYKTAYNTFKLPLYLAMQLKLIDDQSVFVQVDKICFDLGKLYQMKEEYNDCFGEESKTNRLSGFNIQDGICTWLAVMALQRCTAPQRVVFNACYGSKEPAHVERVKLLYEQLKLPQLYREHEGAICESVTQIAETIKTKVPPSLFFQLLDVICTKENR